MMIGLMFASIYAAMDRLQAAPFFANGSPANSKTFQYFSFATLTTTGYGDFTAGTSSGRAVAIMEALGGQIFLATLIARLVASYRSPRRLAASGDTESSLSATGPLSATELLSGTASVNDTEPVSDTVSRGDTGVPPGPPVMAGRSPDGRPRRGTGVRPRAGRPPPVKWRRARRP
jgi:Ion channel